MGTAAAPAFASVGEALDMARASLAFVAAADATELTCEEQAQALRALGRVSSVATAARTSVLSAFTAGSGYAADAYFCPRSWLTHQTGVTKGEAGAQVAWVGRAVRHPEFYAAMAAGDLSESWARVMGTWTGKLPDGQRHQADKLLADEAKAGMDLHDLAELAAEIKARCRPDEPDQDPDDGFDDRSVTVQTTFEGAGVIHGDLTPECAAIVQSVLDALAAPAGAEDDRTKEQRYHDALHEAMRRLVAGGLLPDRAGQPVKALVHLTLADLVRLPGAPALVQEWIAEMRARWAARRAAASETGSDGGAWLDGKAAEAAGCDASVIPVVTGDIDPGVLDELVRLCAHLDRLNRDGDPGTSSEPGGPGEQCAPGQPSDPGQQDEQSGHAGPGTSRQQDGHGEPGPTLRDILEQQVIGSAIALLSGPGGLAGFLRRRQLGTRLGGRSLPLDVGISTGIPAAIRRAVIERDQHCQFPSGCDQPAAGCEVHHLTHKADGGKTSVQDCMLFCFFHHQVVIHRWGWTVVLNPDGTTTAWNKDRTKVLHSHRRNHSPPARPG